MNEEINYTELRFRNATATPWPEAIDVEIEHPEYGWTFYTATAYDEDPRCRDMYNKLKNEPLIPSPITLEDIAIDDAKAHRNALLKESDWTQNPDVPESTSALWVDYRQELRDITDQPGFPMDVVWPVPPQ